MAFSITASDTNQVHEFDLGHLEIVGNCGQTSSEGYNYEVNPEDGERPNIGDFG